MAKQEDNEPISISKVDRKDNISRKFMNISSYSILENIPEMLSEWWTSSGKDMKTFLVDENLINITNEKTFTDILLGKYCFSDLFLLLIKEKLPYNVTLEKLYRLNKSFRKKHLGIPELKTDDNLIISILKEMYSDKKTTRLKSIIDWHANHKEKGRMATARYRQLHPERVKESKRKYRETHKEEIKAYKESRRSITNEQQRRRYHNDIEKSREKRRVIYHKYKEKHREQILETQAQYRMTHREEIRERANLRMKDETYRLKVRERKRASYQKYSAKIQERRKQNRLQNIEQAKLKERKYGKAYRERHREEIKTRNRENYHKNLEENRLKNAERQRKSRNKKRFRTITGPQIMPLLSAILEAKQQKQNH